MTKNSLTAIFDCRKTSVFGRKNENNCVLEKKIGVVSYWK